VNVFLFLKHVFVSVLAFSVTVAALDVDARERHSKVGRDGR
jgi:hypothetical protein